ncbi:MAG: hypothetical protein JWO75_6069 [Actinomycetia bacterium]|nr:hypothetical protein [Actinomycetes bacterium]
MIAGHRGVRPRKAGRFARCAPVCGCCGAGCFRDRGSPGADIATFDPQSRDSLVTVVGLFCSMAVRRRSAGCSPAVTRGHRPGRPAARREPARLRAGRQRRPCQIRNADGGECRLTSRQVHSAVDDPRSPAGAGGGWRAGVAITYLSQSHGLSEGAGRWSVGQAARRGASGKYPASPLSRIRVPYVILY